jgi:type IV pilus assembly protein PilW
MRHPHRGFSLIELLVSLTVVAVVFVGVVAMARVQQRSYTQGHQQRASQENARAALAFIEEKASIAGFGLDAPLALDLDRFHGADCPLPPCARDAVDNSDELVFQARNPRYWVGADYSTEPAGNAWRIQDVVGDTVRVRIRTGQRILAGQIVQAVCRAGSKYAYMTVRDNTPVVTDVNGQDVTITMRSVVSTDPFRRQDAATDGCFRGGEARLYLIDRFRFHVRPVLVFGSRYDPYLMLDTGVDVNADGTIDANDEIVIAEGIELLQVGYVLFDPALPLRGLTPGTAVTFTSGASGGTTGTGITTLSFPGTVQPGQSPYQPTSWYGYSVSPPGAAERRNDHQANIVALKVAVSARSAEPATEASAGSARTPFYNLNAVPSWLEPNVPYERLTVESTIPLRNMLVRGMNDF